MDKAKTKRKQLIGKVVSDKMDKTVVVLVERLVKHSLYKKYVKRHNKFSAHDEKNVCKIGDKVLISETRPLSKTKNFYVKKVLEQVKIAEV